LALYSVAAVEQRSFRLHVGTVQSEDETAAIAQFAMDITRQYGFVGLIAADATEVPEALLWETALTGKRLTKV
jgi:hypothetical protein